MMRAASRRRAPDAFERISRAALTLTDVTAATRYDGSQVLQLDGCFLAGIATHTSAEPDSLVVRMDIDERDRLLEDAPDTYYVTDFYRPYPVVLARLAQLTDAAIQDLLNVSWDLTAAKARRRRTLKARRRDGRARQL
jgi:hypothetical protein